MEKNKTLSAEQSKKLLEILKARFEHNMHRHKGLKWVNIKTKIESRPEKMWALQAMEETGGEPDVIGLDDPGQNYLFYDCSPESPKGRRSLCYDGEALESRKTYKPKDSALGMAMEMGINILTEEEYFTLQQFGNFDTKTSSWLATPKDIRVLGGAIFGDFRFGRVFIYHNGAESYYGARGFRGSLRV
ncbi:MAG: DUF4256 domain-containing protein [Cyclobacterium sp.]|uniref:DUF4256 domain-containing protein n=1 Tax=unclassified Cyclobacterium TaxID=2615055 RepID=UPI0013D27D09|nr:DUF4256 domain-containing protein [Cyclobacterium sp. SYSU L10401]